jgi:hypothetical protein
MGLAVGSLVFAVLCGGCLAIIPGIFAVVNASRVQSLSAQGDFAGAQDAADKARTMAMVTFVVGAIMLVITIAVYALLIASAETTTTY